MIDSIKHCMIFSFVFSTCLFSKTQIRDYEHPRDYAAVTQLCMQNAQVLVEDEYCSTTIHTGIYATKDKTVWGINTWIKVIECDGTVVGFALYHHTSAVLNVASVAAIAVDSTWQGKGYGKQLLDSVKIDVQTRGYSTLWAKVLKSNKKTLEWFKKQGFTVIPKSLDLGLEEQRRINAELCGEVLLKYQLTPREQPMHSGDESAIDKVSYTKQKRSEAMKGLYDDKLYREITKKFVAMIAPGSSFQEHIISRIIRAHLRVFQNSDFEQLKDFAAFVMGKKSLDRPLENELYGILFFVKTNFTEVEEIVITELSHNAYIDVNNAECKSEKCLY
jgi:ribosomal protein S18 acetylase RimI-like enzyme